MSRASRQDARIRRGRKADAAAAVLIQEAFDRICARRAELDTKAMRMVESEVRPGARAAHHTEEPPA